MKPDLVIFDCDGVLVDSETLSVAALRDMIVAAGGGITQDDAYDHFLGRSEASVREILTKEFGLTITDSHLEEMRRRLMDSFRLGLKAMPGISRALRLLPMQRCVASSGTLDRIRISLKVTRLLPLLEPHLFSASMVARGKPAPDLFLYAAARMGKASGQCLVVEDSPAGVEAAKAAGMRVFAFIGGAHALTPAFRERLASSGPDFIFDDMLQLPELVAALGARVRAS